MAAAIVVVLTVVTLVAALLEAWWLAVTAICGLAGAALLAALDVDRRMRLLARETRREVRRELGASGERYTTTLKELEALVAATQILNAQLVGRLDRLQGSIEQAVERPRADPTADG
ncbi:hypothetical protein [Nocardioides sp. AE5]|uniref:hypothetical protein n=1 Tax=Nocardioides sp. AE5 TaxID=2962573 RepID=UPI002882D299|nr:hypothetical protein [Nocardioides sp. AE5]MDT0203979.1 hypothetical protein [Nocardioides sp. AE5]